MDVRRWYVLHQHDGLGVLPHVGNRKRGRDVVSTLFLDLGGVDFQALGEVLGLQLLRQDFPLSSHDAQSIG